MLFWIDCELLFLSWEDHKCLNWILSQSVSAFSRHFNPHMQACCWLRQKSSKVSRLILWGSRLFVQNIMAIHPIVIKAISVCTKLVDPSHQWHTNTPNTKTTMLYKNVIKYTRKTRKTEIKACVCVWPYSPWRPHMSWFQHTFSWPICYGVVWLLPSYTQILSLSHTHAHTRTQTHTLDSDRGLTSLFMTESCCKTSLEALCVCVSQCVSVCVVHQHSMYCS